MDESIFIVNKHGSVHSVTKEHAEIMIADGCRLANKKEIVAWYEMQNLQKPKDRQDGNESDMKEKAE